MGAAISGDESDGDVYVAGFNFDDSSYNERPCYWGNGTPYDLDLPAGARAVPGKDEGR
jgi:hypothetical protein